jgi:spermidine synthase
MKKEFKFGTCTVPDGERGLWTIDQFTISKDEARAFNLRKIMSGRGIAMVDPGTYKRLRHKTRGTVMSNTPFEVRTNYDVFIRAKGRVLINGLGLGMVLEGILSKPEVTYVRVIEIEEDVIKLVGPHFAKDKRVEIINADAYEYRPAVGERFDYVWHDIWDFIGGDNAVLMAQLGRRYNKRVCDASGFWGRDIMRADRRRYG